MSKQRSGHGHRERSTRAARSQDGSGRQRGRKRSSVVLGGLLLAVLVAAAAVLTLRNSEQGPGTAGQGQAAGPVEEAGAEGGRAEVASRAPEFSLQTVDGGVFSLAAERGKVVVLEFLAPGCPDCAADVTGLGGAADRFGDRVRVVIADVGGVPDPRELRDYYRGELGAAKEIVIASDTDFGVAQRYRVRSLGETFVIGPDGGVRWHGRWAGDVDALFEAIERASPA